jgi:hypothetical protein
MRKLLSSLVVATAVLMLASSAMADESDAVKSYKFQVTSIVTSWAFGLSTHTPVLDQLKQEMAKLKPSDSAYKEKKDKAIAILRLMGVETAGAAGQINGIPPVHVANKDEGSALAGFVKGVIADKTKSLKGIKIITSPFWAAKNDTEGFVQVNLTIAEI